VLGDGIGRKEPQHALARLALTLLALPLFGRMLVGLSLRLTSRALLGARDHGRASK
jgi:hypothetical protein